MYKYHCLNPIADIGLNNFTEDYTKIDTDKGAFLVTACVSVVGAVDGK